MIKRFFTVYTVFCILVAASVFSFDHFVSDIIRVPFIWGIFGFYVLATALFHLLSLKTAAGDPKMFIRSYMGSSLVRILLYAIVIVVYRFAAGKEHALVFALAFMAHYFVFTVFEVFVLLRQLKKPS